MGKIKIKEIKSEDYENGRIDSFLISKNIDLHVDIIGVLIDMGFSEKNITVFDTEYDMINTYLFSKEKDVKIFLICFDEEILLIIDSKLDKLRLMKIIEDHFELF